jgi:hypothetical protein
MPTYEIRIAHTIVEVGSLEVEARNKFDAIAIAKAVDLSQIEDWDFNDNVDHPWVAAVYSDDGQLTLDEDDDVEGATDDDEEEEEV